MKLKVTYAWWLDWVYIPCLCTTGFLITLLTGTPFKPDSEKIKYWVKKATTFTIVEDDEDEE